MIFVSFPLEPFSPLLSRLSALAAAQAGRQGWWSLVPTHCHPPSPFTTSPGPNLPTLSPPVTPPETSETLGHWTCWGPTVWTQSVTSQMPRKICPGFARRVCDWSPGGRGVSPGAGTGSQPHPCQPADLPCVTPAQPGGASLADPPVLSNPWLQGEPWTLVRCRLLDPPWRRGSSESPCGFGVLFVFWLVLLLFVFLLMLF